MRAWAPQGGRGPDPNEAVWAGSGRGGVDGWWAGREWWGWGGYHEPGVVHGPQQPPVLPLVVAQRRPGLPPRPGRPGGLSERKCGPPSPGIRDD
jgi:hypothetical protein